MNSRLTDVAFVNRPRIVFAAAVVCLMILVGVALSAFVLPVQEDEDRPPIIVSTGSVILNVARGSWVREAAGRFRQDVTRGKDVRSFSATTGAGAAACTVAGESILVTYGANAISVGRPATGQRRAALVRFQTDAAVTARDAQTLVVATTDQLVSVSNGGSRPEDTCRVVGGRLEIRQVH